jgi:diguanylate cyclase (GGDEF)-like protein
MQVNNSYRILVIDDTPSIHDDYHKVLGVDAASNGDVSRMEALLFGANDVRDDEPRFEIDSAYQGEEGVELLKRSIETNKPYAMAFVDMRMPPGWDGVQTIRELWKVDPNLQVVICTAFSDYTPQQISAELKLGGRMLILRKPFDGIEVLQLAKMLSEKWAIGRRKQDLEHIVEARTAQLKKAALHDALTGLPNRLLFSDRLAHTLARSKRDANLKFAVLFVDVDEFKLVNDSLGHEAGDALLLEIAARLNYATRTVDTVSRGDVCELTGANPLAARLGGDEFALLLDEIRTDADAARVAQRILNEMSRPFHIAGHTIHSGVSIGLTTSSRNYDKADEMLRDADTAMYYAKREGRGRFVMFDQKMHAAAVERLTFESDLRAGINNDEIRAHYQPIVDIHTGRLVGFEALARWMHPKRGMVSPVDFIPMAEDTGLIVSLGSKILQMACKQLAEWQASSPTFTDLTMSVNVSRKQLVSGDLIRLVQNTLSETGIKPGSLKLEITESSVMADVKASLEVLKRIQSLGVQLHIDDFGTGYSSLSCLQNFPLNGLKIDRGFVSDITVKPDQAAILKAIVSLAHSLNLPLVSEGVETTEQSALLQSMGCDYAQGYLFSKPMDSAAATQFVARCATHQAAA